MSATDLAHLLGPPAELAPHHDELLPPDGVGGLLLAWYSPATGALAVREDLSDTQVKRVATALRRAAGEGSQPRP